MDKATGKILMATASVGVIYLLLFALVVSAMVEHILHGLYHFHTEWILLLVGCVLPLIGVIHGVGLWFGWF